MLQALNPAEAESPSYPRGGELRGGRQGMHAALWKPLCHDLCCLWAQPKRRKVQHLFFCLASNLEMWSCGLPFLWCFSPLVCRLAQTPHPGPGSLVGAMPHRNTEGFKPPRGHQEMVTWRSQTFPWMLRDPYSPGESQQMLRFTEHNELLLAFVAKKRPLSTGLRNADTDICRCEPHHCSQTRKQARYRGMRAPGSRLTKQPS